MRECSRSISPERMAKIKDNISQVEHLSEACYVTLRCEMCGEKLRDQVLGFDHVAELAWKKGWRFQNDQVLCQYCKDNQR